MQDHDISRRDFLKIFVRSTIGTFAAGLGGLFYTVDVEPNWLDVEEITLTSPRVAREFDGYKVAQISDIHVGSWINEERLKKVVDLINEQEPDVVAITGDFVSFLPTNPQDNPLNEGLKRLTPKDVTVAVMGNHDYWSVETFNLSEPIQLREIFRESGIIELDNRVHTIRRGNAEFHFAGLDDIWEDRHDLSAVLDQLPEEGYCVLLAHEPDYADETAKTGRFDLQISGHSHGGQVRIPLIGAPILPTWGRKYPIGMYDIGSMKLYTNRGVGMISPTVRFNCRPEITMFTFRSA